MIDLRPFSRLGRFENDWLDSRFHFSFAEYRDPERMGHGALRVWNDDRIAPGGGFDMHPHRDMEIITYVREGAITHRDSLGNEGRTGAGDVQVMSAGTGIVHAEFNLEDMPTALFQVWIFPARKGVAPHWETRRFPERDPSRGLVPLASGRQGHDAALPIHQDAALFGARLAAGDVVRHALEPGRKAYLVASSGGLTVNGIDVGPRDGAAVADEEEIVISAPGAAEIILVDVP